MSGFIKLTPFKTSNLSSLMNSPHTEELVWVCIEKEQACAILIKSCMFIKTLKAQLHIPEVICQIPQLAQIYYICLWTSVDTILY